MSIRWRSSLKIQVSTIIFAAYNLTEIKLSNEKLVIFAISVKIQTLYGRKKKLIPTKIGTKGFRMLLK